MRHIVIASHHRFAAGLRDTLELVGGELGIVDINAYVDETPLEEQAESVFSQFDPTDEVLIFTDMLQGSVNQVFRRYMSDHVFLVTGINLPCALELALAGGPLTADSVRTTIEAARQQLLLVNDQIVEIDEDDE